MTNRPPITGFVPSPRPDGAHELISGSDKLFRCEHLQTAHHIAHDSACRLQDLHVDSKFDCTLGSRLSALNSQTVTAEIHGAGTYPLALEAANSRSRSDGINQTCELTVDRMAKTVHTAQEAFVSLERALFSHTAHCSSRHRKNVNDTWQRLDGSNVSHSATLHSGVQYDTIRFYLFRTPAKTPLKVSHVQECSQQYEERGHIHICELCPEFCCFSFHSAVTASMWCSDYLYYCVFITSLLLVFLDQARAAAYHDKILWPTQANFRA